MDGLKDRVSLVAGVWKEHIDWTPHNLLRGGLLLTFSPAFNLATNDQWQALKEDLLVHTAFFYFSVSMFCASSHSEYHLPLPLCAGARGHPNQRPGLM